MKRVSQQYLVAGPGRSARVSTSLTPGRRPEQVQEAGRVRTTSGERHLSAWLGQLIIVVPWLLLFGAFVLAMCLLDEAGGR
jgi:hypothetical protein